MKYEKIYVVLFIKVSAYWTVLMSSYASFHLYHTKNSLMYKRDFQADSAICPLIMTRNS